MGFFDKLFGGSKNKFKIPEAGGPQPAAQPEGQPKTDNDSRQFANLRDACDTLLAEYESRGGEFVTFEDIEDDNRWVQAMNDDDETSTLNFSYPFSEEPDRLIASKGVAFPAGYTLANWESGTFATYFGPRLSISETAAVIDTLFTKLLGSSPNYSVRGKIE